MVDSAYVNGETAEYAHVIEANKQFKAQGKEEINVPEIVDGYY
jgi:DNA-directed RNA polymerase subunit beta'